MQVILAAINGKYYHTALGLYSLKAAAEQKGISVDLKEWTLKTDMETMVADIKDACPDILGLSVYIWNISIARSLTRRIKELFPNIIIIWGGPETTGRGSSLLQEELAIDYLVSGEGEACLPQLLSAIESGSSCRIPGISGRDEGGIWSVHNLEKIDMAKLPSPYRQMMNWPQLSALDLSHRIVYYESSRGCPFHCSFCFSGGDKPRYRPMEQVKKDLLCLMDMGMKQVKFVDRTFNFPAERCCALVGFLLENYRPGINFHMEIAPNLLNKEFLALLSQSPVGYLQMEAGIQTTYPPALKAMNRAMNWNNVQENLREIIATDRSHVHLDLIAGLPEEGFEQFAHSFNDVYALFPHQLQLGFLKVLPGSRLDREKEKWGLVYDVNAPYEIISTPQISKEELDILRKVDKVIDCFFNCNCFRETFRYLLQHIEGYDSFRFFVDFALWLPTEAENTWKQMPHRSRLLYDFLIKVYPEHQSLWQDLLVIDWFLYGRESRIPQFLLSHKVNCSWPRRLQEKVEEVWPEFHIDMKNGYTLLHLCHTPIWDRLGIGAMVEGESYLLLDKNHTWGVLKKARYLDVSAYFL